MKKDDSSVPGLAGLELYSREDVVSSYASAESITPVEEYMFSKHIPKGAKVLDLGVGGGRTSRRLSETAVEYLGIDYSAGMIAACKRRFPDLQFKEMDAAQLDGIPSSHYDVVVFSFNGLGNLYPRNKLTGSLRECNRVLKAEGRLILSLHHAGSLAFRLQVPGTLGAAVAQLSTVGRSIVRLLSRICRRAFWRGQGYIKVGTHGGMLVYACTPQGGRELLSKYGFATDEVMGDDYPLPNIGVMTRWYYYAAKKTQDV